MQKLVILVAVNIIATSFLVFTYSDGYPHKYRIRSALWTIIYPSSDALFWKHGELSSALVTDTGIYASRTAPLSWTNLFLIKFFNANGSAERMHVSRPGSRRVLHSTDLSLEDLNRFVLHDNLFEFVEFAECPEKNQNHRADPGYDQGD